jgi:hypothetical protein
MKKKIKNKKNDTSPMVDLSFKKRKRKKKLETEA